jgi:hypothetical protein
LTTAESLISDRYYKNRGNSTKIADPGGQSGEKEKDMLYIYYKDETGTYLIGEIMTNRSITVDEALEIAGVDMDQWADAKSWDGYDWNCIELSYKEGLEMKGKIATLSVITRCLMRLQIESCGSTNLTRTPKIMSITTQSKCPTFG